jgi:hypothetical protein
MKLLSAWRKWAVVATSCALAACGSSGNSGQANEESALPPPDNPPTITGTPIGTAKVGQEYLFEPSAHDPDGDTLTFAILNRPDWATFSPTTGRLRGTPPASAQPEYPSIQISVTDGKQTASLPAFKLTVDAVQPQNTAPVISGTPATNVVTGNAYSFTPVATDPDGQTLTFSIANRPNWAQFDTVTGRLTGTPAAGQVGTYGGITISVSDGTAQASLPAFTISVSEGSTPGPSNQAPVISGTPPQAVTAGQAYRFQPAASDPDGQSLTFAITNKPTWATFSSATGELSGTPGATHVGQTSNIIITVSDGQATASLPAFAITVLASNSPPTISGLPTSNVTAGQAYVFQPSATDADGQTLVFSIVNKPQWANFSTSSGRLSGTPTQEHVGSYSNIVISVSDGAASATLAPFSIVVASSNRAPTISGTPPTSVTAGQAYSFRPTASDPDGQALTFSIAGKPSWANFNTTNGTLSGTPTSSDVGSYASIVITASDGSLSASLPAFAITVAEVQTGSATLSWTPPTLNEDGSPLTNLKGYRIYYGTSSSNLGTMIDIPNSGVTSAIVENLSPATWYFALKAYNTSNVESSLSNIASKTIR